MIKNFIQTRYNPKKINFYDKVDYKSVSAALRIIKILKENDVKNDFVLSVESQVRKYSKASEKQINVLLNIARNNNIRVY
jgi:hypothetical protein